MSGRIRVLIWYRCPPDKLDSFIETFHAISTQLAGVPGLLCSDLLQARREEGSVVLMSAWESAEAFATWEASGTRWLPTCRKRRSLELRQIPHMTHGGMEVFARRRTFIIQSEFLLRPRARAS